jgi:atypical dual specificity phosphatase
MAAIIWGVSAWFRGYGFSDVYDRLIVGAVPLDFSDVRLLAALGVTRVLNLVEDREYPPGARKAVEQALAGAGIVEQRRSSEDFGPLSSQLLDDSAELVNSWLDDGEIVYLHCRAGWQRSATVAGAVLSSRLDIDPDTALRQIQSRKPTAEPLPHQREDLLAWWDKRLSGSESPK